MSEPVAELIARYAAEATEAEAQSVRHDFEAALMRARAAGCRRRAEHLRECIAQLEAMPA